MGADEDGDAQEGGELELGARPNGQLGEPDGLDQSEVGEGGDGDKVQLQQQGCHGLRQAGAQE